MRRATFEGHRRRPRPPAIGPRRPYPLHTILAVLVTALALGVGVGVGFFTTLNTRNAVRRLSDTVLREIRDQTVATTQAFLGSARPSLSILRDLIEHDPACAVFAQGEPRDAALRARGRHLLRILRSASHYDMVYYGDAMGYFTAARRKGSGYLVEFRWPSGGETARRTYRVSHEDQWTREPQADRRSFDPRTRPWYTQAARQLDFVWTDPYVFHEAGQPGITSGLPVTAPDGRLCGVLGVDFYLHDLDTFVTRFRGDGRYVCILSPEGAVVAQPGRSDQELRVHAAGASDLPALPTAAASKDPVIQAIGKAHLGPVTRDDIVLRVGREIYLAASDPIEIGPDRKWAVVVAVPRSEVVGVVQTNTLITFGVCMAFMLLATLLGAWVAVSIARPLRSFVGEMDQVANLVISDNASPHSRIREVEEMGRALDRMKAGLRSYQRYVPSAVVRFLHDAGDEARVGGQHARITVSFADIKDFTGYAEVHEPAEVVARLGEFLELVEGQVTEFGGIVDKYSGDEVMALWGTPIAPLENSEWAACEAALAYVDSVRQLSAEHAGNGVSILRAGIGIHTGDALVGNIGSRVRLSYTAIGDAVNVASRVEGLNRFYRTQVLVTEATLAAVKDHFEARLVDKVAVKGRREGIRLYELLARHGQLDEQTQALCGQHYVGMKLYRERDWLGAHAAFMQALSIVPDDGPSLVLAERCAQFAASPPPSTWDGVFQANWK